MDGQYKELINVHDDHGSLGVWTDGAKCTVVSAGSYHSDEREISKELYDLLLAELKE